MSTLVLRILFIALLIYRLLFPFYYNPADSLVSDMLRHINNGFNLTHPNFLNAMDPKGYQVFLHLLLMFPKEQAHAFDALFNGILCAGLPWCWYKAMREITTRNKAFIIALLIGIHIGFLAIYSFFLIETLLLTSVALAVWMTLRAVRKHTLTAFLAATLCWLIAAFTKQTAIPIALMGLGYALAFQRHKIRAAIIACCMLIACIIPAGMHSIDAANVFAPFGITDAQTIARKSEHTDFGFHVFAGQYETLYGVWVPEALLGNPLAPLGVYKTDRIHDTYIADIDLTQGSAAWDRALEAVEKNHHWQDTLNDYEENVVFLFFAYDDVWPSSRFTYPSYLREPGFWLRWLWMPCFLIALCYGPFARMAPGKTWILLVAFSMTLIFLLQDVGIVEGRYRKIIGPFLFTSMFFLAESIGKRDRENVMNLKRFALHFYLYPFLRQFLAPLFPERDTEDAPERARQAPDDKTTLLRTLKRIVGLA